MVFPIGNLHWDSLRNLKKHPLSTNIVMVVTVWSCGQPTTWPRRLGRRAAGRDVSLRQQGWPLHGRSSSSLDETTNNRLYAAPARCSSARPTSRRNASNFKESLGQVTIDLNRAHFWDITAVAAVGQGGPSKVPPRRQPKSKCWASTKRSATIVDRFGVHDKPAAIGSTHGPTEKGEQQ